MPVLETERRGTPRSALRYRPIETGEPRQPGSEPPVLRQRRSRPDVRATSAPVPPADDLAMEEDPFPPRKRRAMPPPPPRQSVPPPRARQRLHPLFFVGAGLLIAILLWTGITQLMAWGANAYNTLIYGYPRTYQLDAVVGHNDGAQNPSHFIAVNLHGSINIIEFPGGDPSRSRVFVFSSSLGPGADQAVVTLRFVDFDHNGKPDMLIAVGGVQGVLINDGSTFRLPTPAEQQQILQALQHTPS